MTAKAAATIAHLTVERRMKQSEAAATLTWQTSRALSRRALPAAGQGLEQCDRDLRCRRLRRRITWRRSVPCLKRHGVEPHGVCLVIWRLIVILPVLQRRGATGSVLGCLARGVYVPDRGGGRHEIAAPTTTSDSSVRDNRGCYYCAYLEHSYHIEFVERFVLVSLGGPSALRPFLKRWKRTWYAEARFRYFCLVVARAIARRFLNIATPFSG